MNVPLDTPAVALVGEADDSATTRELTDKEDIFAKTVVETGNRSLAYRRAYRIGVNTKPAWIWSEASKVAARPHIRARIAKLMEAAASETVASKAQLIKFLWDRIHVDRRELVNHVRRCCRHCYGTNHDYQWVDDMEYMTALAKALDENAMRRSMDQGEKELPTDVGGYGFDPHREPEVTCAAQDCMGDGYGKTVITDTTKLQGAAATVYEGVKETKNGIEIVMASVKDDIATLSKLLGWSIDKVEGSLNTSNGALPDEAYNIPSTSTPEEASRKYLALVS